MSQTISVEVPDDLLDDLNKQARAAGTSPGEYIARNLPRIVRKPDERLRRHFGSVSLGHPLFSSNEEIDQALAEEYGSRGER